MQWDRQIFKKVFLVWLISLACYLCLRLGLGQIYGTPPSKISTDPLQWLIQLRTFFNQTLFLYFNKVYYPVSLLYLIGLVTLAIAACCYRLLSLNKALRILGLVLVSGAVFFILNYNAPRALYGAHLFTCSLLAVGIFVLRKRTWQVSAVALLFLSSAFFLQSRMIFETKDANHKQITLKVHDLKTSLELCEEPCSIVLKDLEEGLKRDWVLDSANWLDFGNYVHQKFLPEKKIHFHL